METNQEKYPKRWAALAVLCLSLLIIAIDTTVLNMSIPSISADLQASTAQLMWIVDVYSIVFASLMLTTGTLGDRFGRKLMLAIGLAVFGIGSLAAAQATSSQMLITFRVLQGIGGSMMMPSTLSIIINIFPDHGERSRAFAIWSGTFGIGAGVGPLVGGVLLHFFSWPAVFYLNIPVVLVGLIGGYYLIPESKDPRKPKLDFPGLVISFLGIFLVVYSIIKAGEAGWSSLSVIMPMIFGLLFLLAFVQWERHTKTPMLPLDFFKKRTFSTGSVAMFMNAFSLFGTGYFFSQYFQSIIGYSPLIASLAMSPQLVIQYFATLNSVNVVKKIGTKWTIAMGLFVAGIGVFIFTQMTQVNTPYPILIIPLVIMGIGMGNIMTPVMTSTLSSLPPERSGIGSAVADTFLNVGGALGFALNGAIMNRFYRLQIMENIPGLGLSDSTFAMILSSVQNALVAAKEMTADLANQVIFTAKESFVHGMDIALIVISGTLMVTCLFVLFTVPVSIETENKVE